MPIRHKSRKSWLYEAPIYMPFDMETLQLDKRD